MVVPSPPPSPDKPALRRALRERRHAYAASLDRATRAALEEGLADAVAPLFALAAIVAAYHPMRDEISPLNAMARAAATGCTLAYPHFVDRDARMTFRTGDPVEAGPWGILQPPGDSAIVTPDLILVPLIAIDPAGNRIGMGKGHYDRVLPGLRAGGARLVGVGWDFQRLEECLAPDAWDVPLDGFASPSGLDMMR